DFARSALVSSHATGDHPTLPSFPTRRSSDLIENNTANAHAGAICVASSFSDSDNTGSSLYLYGGAIQNNTASSLWSAEEHQDDRSEEHTSELQSRFDLVCRLPREKKKNIHTL